MNHLTREPPSVLTGAEPSQRPCASPGLQRGDPAAHCVRGQHSQQHPLSQWPAAGGCNEAASVAFGSTKAEGAAAKAFAPTAVLAEAAAPSGRAGKERRGRKPSPSPPFPLPLPLPSTPTSHPASRVATVATAQLGAMGMCARCMFGSNVCSVHVLNLFL